MTVTSSELDTGTGYGRPAPSYDARLTEVGRGTPMGEALRRYWHPIACSSALTSDVPHRTRILGEDLVVFRDGNGRPGVVFERCAHRGSSLFYGRRRRLRQMVDDVEAGRDPENVERDEAKPRSTKAGIFTVGTKKTSPDATAAAGS